MRFSWIPSIRFCTIKGTYWNLTAIWSFVLYWSLIYNVWSIHIVYCAQVWEQYENVIGIYNSRPHPSWTSWGTAKTWMCSKVPNWWRYVTIVCLLSVWRSGRVKLCTRTCGPGRGVQERVSFLIFANRLLFARNVWFAQCTNYMGDVLSRGCWCNPLFSTAATSQTKKLMRQTYRYTNTYRKMFAPTVLTGNTYWKNIAVDSNRYRPLAPAPYWRTIHIDTPRPGVSDTQCISERCSPNHIDGLCILT